MVFSENVALLFNFDHLPISSMIHSLKFLLPTLHSSAKYNRCGQYDDSTELLLFTQH